ncbi:MAG: RadC family protein [Bacteroidota bacterium]
MEDKYKLGHRARTMEKFLKNSENFSKTDILELILFFCIPRKDTKIIAKNINSKFDTLLSFFSSSNIELNQIEGFGLNSIVFIKVIYEIAIRISFERIKQKDIVKNFNDLVVYCKLKVSCLKSEQFRVIFLSAKNHIIKEEVLFFGTITSVHIYPREIIKKCIDLGSVSIVLVHNHPSGDPTPSSEDIEITKLLHKTLKTINVCVFDHIIISENNFISFRQNKIPPFL